MRYRAFERRRRASFWTQAIHLILRRTDTFSLVRVREGSPQGTLQYVLPAPSLDDGDATFEGGGIQLHVADLSLEPAGRELPG